MGGDSVEIRNKDRLQKRKKRISGKPIYRYDCKYFAVLLCHTEIVNYRCLSHVKTFPKDCDIHIISCGIGCPFFAEFEE